MLSFSHIIIKCMIYYDENIRRAHKFFYQKYGARIWPQRSPPEFNVIFCTFEKGPNPGGEDRILSFLVRRFGNLPESSEPCLVLKYTIFDYKIIPKYRHWGKPSEIYISKFLPFHCPYGYAKVP